MSAKSDEMRDTRALAGSIEGRILVLRGHRVIMDADLAKLYGVSTRRLNEQVRRNLRRFPEEFMLQLTEAERVILKSQFATSSLEHGGRRKRPYAFTEHGALMVANVLNSIRAVEASVLVVRAFVRLCQILTQHREISAKLLEIESRLGGHDKSIGEIISTIRQLMQPAPGNPRGRIGTHDRAIREIMTSLHKMVMPMTVSPRPCIGFRP